MRRRSLAGFGAATIACAAVAYARWAPPRWEYRHEIGQVNGLAAQVEAYRRAHAGHLPEQYELHFASANLFYDPQPDGGYRVGFSEGFDENYSFDPATKRWSWDD